MDPFLTVNSKNLVLQVQSLGATHLSTAEASGVVRVFKKVQSEDKSWHLNNHLSIKIPIIRDDTFTTSISSSRDGNLIAAYEDETKSVKVFNIIKKKMIFRIDWHQGKVDHVLFDKQNKYLVTGGNDGKVCIWSSSTGKLLYTLPRHNDFVSSLEFSPSNKRFASGGYDRSVHVVDLRKMETIAILRLKHKTAIVSMSFFAVSFIATLDKSGYILIWDYKKSEFLFSLPKSKSEPIYSTIIEDEYLIVACKDSYVYLYSIEKRKLLNMRYIYSEQGIKAISFDLANSILFISTLNNAINCYDLLYGRDDVKAYVSSANYPAAYSLLTQNPILEDMEPHVKILFEIWDDAVKDAVAYLEDEEKENAKRALAPFIDIPSKADLIQGILNEYKDFQQFRDSIDKNNFQLAYTLLIKHPVYKQSSYYSIMQDEWDDCVKKATLALEQNLEEIDKEMNKIFINFRGISEKLTFIREIASKKTALSLFNKHFDKGTYIECFSIAKDHEFLMDTENYRNLLVKQDSLYAQVKDTLSRGLYSRCKTYAGELMAFPIHRQEVSEILNNLNKIDALIDFYTEKDYRSMLNLIQKYPFLEELSEVTHFHDEFQVIMEVAETHAAKGNVSKILELFEPYLQIQQLRERMCKIVSSSYIQQMRFLLTKFPNKTPVIISGLNNYVDIFGVDDAILGYVSFVKETIGLELMQEEEKSVVNRANYERWIKTNLPARIF